MWEEGESVTGEGKETTGRRENERDGTIAAEKERKRATEGERKRKSESARVRGRREKEEEIEKYA